MGRTYRTWRPSCAACPAPRPRWPCPTCRRIEPEDDMNLVKKSLYLCIGVLLALLGLQGAQSLYQVSRLSAAADDVAATSKLSGDARQLWSKFLDTEKALQAAIAFVDAASA